MCAYTKAQLTTRLVRSHPLLPPRRVNLLRWEAPTWAPTWQLLDNPAAEKDEEGWQWHRSTDGTEGGWHWHAPPGLINQQPLASTGGPAASASVFETSPQQAGGDNQRRAKEIAAVAVLSLAVGLVLGRLWGSC